MKLSPEVCFGPRKNRLNFYNDLDYDPDPIRITRISDKVHLTYLYGRLLYDVISSKLLKTAT